jgi:hypothetical protein
VTPAHKNPAVLQALEGLAKALDVETKAGRFEAHAWGLVVFSGDGPTQIIRGGCSCKDCSMALAAGAARDAGIDVPGFTKVSEFSVRRRHDA